MNTVAVGSHLQLAAAGTAGSITGLTVLGSGYAANQGLHAGLSTDAAKNGGVTNIVADSPAANAIGAANAVTTIAGLNVKRIGADLNTDFIVTDGAGTWTGPGDAGSLIDGIVLVRKTPANLAALAGKIIAPNFLFAV